ncbi:MAG: FAD-dependent oxidoreductase, partial [Candidatus Methylopumilus sp.]|nr:FAD-dependent oxidoreductase [Candidatus Methylopumilus sp.]
MSKHVVIVGGGIVGCMTAMELVDRGHRVTIVERNQIASQTSGESSWAGGGIVFPLLPWMYSEHVNALTRFGAEKYREICERLERETNHPTGFHQSGFLILPNFDSQLALSWCEQNQVEVESVKASQFEGVSSQDENALWLPKVCQIRPPYLMQALRLWLEQHQVTLLENTELSPLQELNELTDWKTLDGR